MDGLVFPPLPIYACGMKISETIHHKPCWSLVLAAAAVSVAMLGVALVGQYGFGLHPCELCLAQRYPYALIALIGFAGVKWGRSERVLGRIALVCGLLFLADAGIAAYHAGVELGIFTGPSGCTNHNTGEQTLEEMRAAIMNAALVPCDQPMAHILGLSMAGWNAVAATFFAVGMFAAPRLVRRYAR